jgi:hypothetical protein
LYRSWPNATCSRSAQDANTRYMAIGLDPEAEIALRWSVCKP